MSEPGGGEFPEQQPQKDLYTKPKFPFYQEEFTGPKPEQREEERLGVLSVFERTVDAIRDNATDVIINPDIRYEVDGDEAFEEVAFARGSDGRKVTVTILRRDEGAILERELAIDWGLDPTRFIEGSTSYTVDYLTVRPTVKRDDDNDMLALGAPDTMTGIRDRDDARTIASESGFNNQPIGIREAQELQKYMGVATPEA